MKIKTLKKLTQIKLQQGAVLLEALIAVLIFSMGILAIAGLQTVMSKNTTEAQYRAEASYSVQREISGIMTNPASAPALNNSTTRTIAGLPGGSLVISQPSLGRFNFVATWQVPGQDARRYEANASTNF